jgi:hypothetical protein
MAYDDTYKGKGSLFVNEDCQGKQPHLRGFVEVTKAQIDKLIEMTKAGVEVKLQIAAWRKTAASGAKYMFLSTEAYLKDASDESTDGWKSTDGKEDHGWGESAPPLTDPPATVAEDFTEDDIPF